MSQRLSEAIHADLALRITRLGDQLDRMINLVTIAREALENEMFEPNGFLKGELRVAYLNKMTALARQLDMLVSAKIRWDKNQKAMADMMTPEQERLAVRQYIRAMSPYDRKDFLRNELDYHVKHTTASSPAGNVSAPEQMYMRLEGPVDDPTS